jgi:aminoglycoside 3-N-acetyltransferase
LLMRGELDRQVKALGIDPAGTLLIHSSMKSIGPVEGGADAVLDAFSAHMRDGLLILPTHTWRQMSESYTVFDVVKEPSCVGLLTNLFRGRPGVIRSWHPTHSVAALGREAAAYTAGEERTRTPCPRDGCWGRLYDRRAVILFLGCSLKCNTFLHGVEEWCGVTNRLAETPQDFTVVTPAGERLTVPQYRHHTEPELDISDHYDKMAPAFEKEGAIRRARLGEASCIVADAAAMADITARYLAANEQLFADAEPITLL